MAARPVKVSFVADTADLRSDLKKVEASFDSAGAKAKSSGSKIDASLNSTADAADGVASKGSQAAGALSGLGDLIGGKFGTALMTAGVAFQAAADGGDLLNVVTESNIVRKIKDTAVTVAQTTATVAKTAADYAASTAAKAWAGAQAVLNAVMAANPIFLVVAAIALLVAGFILAYKYSETFRDIVGGAFDAVKTVILNFTGPGLIIKHWNTIKSATEAAWGFIKDKIVTPIVSARDAVTGAVGNIQEKITSAWSTVKTKTSDVYNGIKDIVTGKFDDIVAFIKGVPGRILDLGSKFKDAGAGVMDKIIEGIKSAAGFINDIATTIGNAVKGVINNVIDKVNRALEFNIDVAGVSVGINPPDIPHLARGGVTTGPTLAVVGDNPGGREAIIPLNRASIFGDEIRDALKEMRPNNRSAPAVPLIGNVTQSPGESTDALAERLWMLTRSRG